MVRTTTSYFKSTQKVFKLFIWLIFFEEALFYTRNKVDALKPTTPPHNLPDPPTFIDACNNKRSKRATACVQNTFGVGCAGVCHCDDGERACDPVTGHCTSGLCARGWTGFPACQQQCPSGMFGLKCAFQCHCAAKDKCSAVNGLCQSGKCSHGFGGPACQRRLPILISSPTIQDVSSHNLTAIWSRWQSGVDLGEGPVTAYALEILHWDTMKWSTYSVIRDSSLESTMHVIVKSLRPYTWYKFRIVIYWNDQGKEKKSIPGPETRYIITKCSAPSTAPVNITAQVTKIEKNSIATVHAMWKDPVGKAVNCGRIASHIINIRCLRVCGGDQTLQLQWSDSSVTLTDLSVGAELDLDIVAINDAGYSSSPSPVYKLHIQQHTTDPENGSVLRLNQPVIANITNFQNTSRTDSSIGLSWQADSSTHDVFKVSFKMSKSYSTMDRKSHEIRTTNKHVTLKDLHPGTLYSITVTSSLTGRSQRISVWTAPSQLSRPLTPVFLSASGDTATVLLTAISSTTMPIDHYVLFVKNLTFDSAEPNLGNINYPHLNDEAVYITAKLTSEDLNNENGFVIGDNNTYMGNRNIPLAYGDLYLICLSCVSSLDGEQSVSTSHPCLTVNMTVYRTGVSDIVVLSNVPTKNAGLAAGLITFFVVLIIVGLLTLAWFMWKKHRWQKQTLQYDDIISYHHHRSDIGGGGLYNSIWDQHGLTVSGDSAPISTHDTTVSLPSHTVSLANLWESYKTKTMFGFDEIDREFRSLGSESLDSTIAAHHPLNWSLNRESRVIPYDRNRATIPHLEEQEAAGEQRAGHTDEPTEIRRQYVNASLIANRAHDDSYHDNRTVGYEPCYLVTQCPLSTSFGLFWRLVYEYDADTIVTLMDISNTKHGLESTTEKYWPGADEEPCHYQNIRVETLSEHKLAHVSVRHFEISRTHESGQGAGGGDSADCRTVTQYQYHSWRQGGVPGAPHAFANLVQRVRAARRRAVVVHCRTGGGRSGLYLAIDRLISQGERTDAVNVLGCVTSLRQERPCMVDTAAQYRYVYRAVAEHFRYRGARFDHVTELQGAAELAACTQTDCGRARVQSEFTDIVQDSQALDFFNSTLRSQNRAAQFVSPHSATSARYHSDATRGLAGQHASKFSTTTCDSYSLADHFLITTLPSLHSDVEPFFNLLVTRGVYCLVILDDHVAGHVVPADGESLSAGSCTVRAAPGLASPAPNYRKRNITVRCEDIAASQRSLTCFMLPADAWRRDVSGGVLPASEPHQWARFVADVYEWRRACSRDEARVAVLTSGAEESSACTAVFCAFYNMAERYAREQAVDVCADVRYVRSRIINSITTHDQYVFCYEALSKFILNNLKCYLNLHEETS